MVLLLPIKEVVSATLRTSRDWDDSIEQEVQDTEVGQMKDRQRSEAAEADKALQDAIDQYGEDSEEAREARQAKNDMLSRHKKERKSIGGKDDRGKGKDRGETSRGDSKTGSNDTWYGEQVVAEKSALKSIPGYYDGKPSILGFPDNPPPEMIKGYHPDLVTPEGQKKQSDRYNRLDPQSAKAMPKTGNPFIDAKVKAAVKSANSKKK